MVQRLDSLGADLVQLFSVYAALLDGLGVELVQLLGGIKAPGKLLDGYVML